MKEWEIIVLATLMLAIGFINGRLYEKSMSGILNMEKEMYEKGYADGQNTDGKKHNNRG